MAIHRSRPPALQSHPPPPTHSFPKMPVEEILEDMSLFKRPITKENIRQPTPESVRAVFLFFIEHIYGTSEEDMRQPSFGCLDGLAYPELHDESIPILHFLRSCQKMFVAAQYHDFRLRDITQPVAGRFHWQISALINYAKFRENRLRLFAEMAASGEELREQHALLIKQNDDIQEQINEIESARAAEEPAVAKQKESVAELAAELSTLHKQQVDLAETTKEFKSKLQAAIEKISSLKFQHMAVSQELETLEASVVPSPDRVKAEISEAYQRVDAEKENLLTTQHKTRELQTHCDEMSRACADTMSAYKLVEEAVAEMNKVKDIENRVNKAKGKITELENETERIVSSRKHLERQLESVKQRVSRVRQQRDELDVQARESETRLAEQERQANQELESSQRQIAENSDRAAEISKRIQRLVQDFESEIQETVKKLDLVDKKSGIFRREVSGTNELIEAASRKALDDLCKVVQASGE